MAYDMNRIQSLFISVCKDAGCNVKVPIKLNGRLTRTLGRVKFSRQGVGGAYEATAVEFSKQLLENVIDEDIEKIIKHEAAHYIATYRTGEHHGHDALFKAICNEIGTPFDAATAQVEYTKPKEELFKYNIYCPSCDKVVGNYRRMGKVMKNIESCYCVNCGKFGLKVIQNW